MNKQFILVLTLILMPALDQVVSAKALPDSKAKKKSAKILTQEERIFGLTKIYLSARQHFAYFEQVPDLDWDQAFREYIPLVQEEQALLEYYRTLQRFIALLEDGHTNVFLPNSVARKMDRLPLKVEYIQKEWVVTERMPSKEILQKDIPVGTILLSIEGLPANEYIEKEFFPYLAHGTIQGKRTAVNWKPFFKKEQKVEMAFIYPDGSDDARTISASRKTIKWNDELRNTYTHYLGVGPDLSIKELGNGVLYVRYRQCTSEVQEEFCRLIRDMEDAPKAMIVDLRGNPGGNTPQQAVAHLISSPIPLYRFKTRWSVSYINAQMSWKTDRVSKEAVLDSKRGFMELPDRMGLDWFVVSDGNFQLPPADKSYKGKLVVLIDNETGSAAEDMTVLLHACGRATVIGEVSVGSTGQPLNISLPGGGRARICTANCTYPDGKEFVGVGVQPDIPVDRTIEGVAAGHDEILQAALRYLQSENNRKK